MKSFVDFKKLILRIWLILWFILFVLLIMKLLFNKWYPIIVTNKTLITICNFIDQQIILKHIVGAIFYFFNAYIILCTTIYKKKLKLITTIIILIVSTTISILKYYKAFLGFVPECILVIIIPIVYNIKCKTFSKKVLNVLIPIGINMILMLWQLNVLFIRGYQDTLSNIPFLINIILQLDYYIFLIITYIGACFMGYFGLWFWGKQKTELEAMKAAELKKENPDEKLIADIDERLSRIEKAINKQKEAE